MVCIDIGKPPIIRPIGSAIKEKITNPQLFHKTTQEMQCVNLPDIDVDARITAMIK